MHPRFSIDVDRRNDLVRIVLTGLFSPGDVSEFFEARRKAHAMLRCAPHQHVTLTDLRAMKIMPRDTVAAFTILLAHPQSRSRRLAFALAPTLVRSQLTRILAGRDCRYFDDPAQAEAWLIGAEEMPLGDAALPATRRASQ
jgi:hypothetical protein